MSDHVMITTIVRNTYLGNKSSTDVTTGATAQARNPTTTRPATNLTTTTATRGSIVFGSTSNYMKIHPWASAATPTIRVIGWALCSDTRYWIPHLIAEVTMASLRSAGTGLTLNSTELLAAATLTKGAGDAKLFAPSTGNTDAYFVVDSQGFELVELNFVATADTKVNAHVGEM
jgi:hypothetical protein